MVNRLDNIVTLTLVHNYHLHSAYIICNTLRGVGSTGKREIRNGGCTVQEGVNCKRLDYMTLGITYWHMQAVAAHCSSWPL